MLIKSKNVRVIQCYVIDMQCCSLIFFMLIFKCCSLKYVYIQVMFFFFCYYFIVIRCVLNYVFFFLVESRVRVIVLLGWIVLIYVFICFQVGRGVSFFYFIYYRFYFYFFISGVLFVFLVGGRRRFGFGIIDSGILLIRIIIILIIWSVLKMK